MSLTNISYYSRLNEGLNSHRNGAWYLPRPGVVGIHTLKSIIFLEQENGYELQDMNGRTRYLHSLPWISWNAWARFWRPAWRSLGARCLTRAWLGNELPSCGLVFSWRWPGSRKDSPISASHAFDGQHYLDWRHRRISSWIKGSQRQGWRGGTGRLITKRGASDHLTTNLQRKMKIVH